MERIIVAQLCLCAIFLIGCSRYTASYRPTGKSKSDAIGDPKSASSNPNSENGTSKPGKVVVGPNNQPVETPVTDQETLLQLNAQKFQGFEGLKAIVSYGDFSSELIPMQVDGKVGSLSVKGLPANQTDVLNVQVFQGDGIRFVAKRAATSLKADTQNTIVLNDCQIMIAPWDGKTNDGSCAWTIGEKK